MYWKICTCYAGDIFQYTLTLVCRFDHKRGCCDLNVNSYQFCKFGLNTNLLISNIKLLIWLIHQAFWWCTFSKTSLGGMDIGQIVWQRFVTVSEPMWADSVVLWASDRGLSVLMWTDSVVLWASDRGLSVPMWARSVVLWASEKHIKDDRYLVPSALYEAAMVHLYTGHHREAKHLLTEAKYGKLCSFWL